MSTKPTYSQRDIQYIERTYLLSLKEYLTKNPTNTEANFLDRAIEELRSKVDQSKDGFYKNKANKTMEAFYRENLKRQSIYLDLLLERKKLAESKKPKALIKK